MSAKQKSHSGAKKRYKVLKNGIIKRGKQNHRHILTKKTTKRKRDLRKQTYVSKAQEKTIRNMVNV